MKKPKNCKGCLAIVDEKCNLGIKTVPVSKKKILDEYGNEKKYFKPAEPCFKPTSKEALAILYVNLLAEPSNKLPGNQLAKVRFSMGEDLHCEK